MKKLICIILSLTLLLSLSACGDKPASPAPSNQNTQQSGTPGSQESGQSGSSVQGEYFEAGNFKVLVPKGWKAFQQHDVFNDDPKAMNPNMLMIGKGAKSDTDVYSNPAITVNYAGKSTKMLAPNKEYYDNVKDLSDMTTGSHTWKGFSCESSGQKLFILFEDQGKIQYQASIAYETSSGKISLDDADVQAILASIESTNAEDIAANGSGSGTPAVTPAENTKPAVTPSDSSKTEALKKFSGDWNGALLFYNCKGRFKSLDNGVPVGAIGRFVIKDDGSITPFIGIDVEDTPFVDLSAKYDEVQDCLMIAGSWIQTRFENIPMTEKDGTLSFYLGFQGENDAVNMAIILRRIGDEGWTNEYPKLSQSQIEYCRGKSFDELAELLGYKSGDYPSGT